MARSKHRRVRTDPAPGADPTPQSFADGRDVPVQLADEDRLGAWGDDDGLDVLPDASSSSNTERLERDRPPHYA